MTACPAASSTFLLTLARKGGNAQPEYSGILEQSEDVLGAIGAEGGGGTGVLGPTTKGTTRLRRATTAPRAFLFRLGCGV